MTVGEVRKICDGEPIQLIGSRTGKKLANSWNNVTEVLARYDNHESCGIFASMRVQTDRVNMPNYITPIICIWVTGEYEKSNSRSYREKSLPSHSRG